VGQQGQCDERVGGEQVECDRAVTRVSQDPIQRRIRCPRELGRKQNRTRSSRIGANPGPEGGWSVSSMPVQPVGVHAQAPRASAT
jgi:hypothetical protein